MHDAFSIAWRACAVVGTAFALLEGMRQVPAFRALYDRLGEYAFESIALTKRDLAEKAATWVLGALSPGRFAWRVTVLSSYAGLMTALSLSWPFLLLEAEPPGSFVPAAGPAGALVFVFHLLGLRLCVYVLSHITRGGRAVDTVLMMMGTMHLLAITSCFMTCGVLQLPQTSEYIHEIAPDAGPTEDRYQQCVHRCDEDRERDVRLQALLEAGEANRDGGVAPGGDLTIAEVPSDAGTTVSDDGGTLPDDAGDDSASLHPHGDPAARGPTDQQRHSPTLSHLFPEELRARIAVIVVLFSLPLVSILPIAVFLFIALGLLILRSIYALWLRLARLYLAVLPWFGSGYTESVSPFSPIAIGFALLAAIFALLAAIAGT